MSYQEDWDNSGLQVGERNASVHAALLTIDVTESVVREAVEKHCDLIVSHHPILFHGLRHITGATPQECCVALAIRHGIAIYASHTPMDACLHGVSGRMAERIGLSAYRVLVPKESHPAVGLGVIGELPAPMPFRDLVAYVYRQFLTPRSGVRFVEPPAGNIRTVALCGGAGAEFLEAAVSQGADVYISADFKYHELQYALGRIGVIDLDHWVSEQFTRDLFRELLSPHIPVYQADSDCSPVCYLANSLDIN